MANAISARFDSVRYAILVALLCACFVMGGASRNDVFSLIALYPLTAIALAAFLLTPGRLRWHDIRVPMAFLIAGAAIAAVQLIPLPPAVWMALPGHERYAQSASVIGMAQPWRPISLAPDLTLSSLMAFLVPTTVLIGCASVSSSRCRDLVVWIAAFAVASAALGVLQMSGGSDSPLYTYRTTNPGLPTGLLANRNHQALLLAIAFPLIALWAARGAMGPRRVVVGWSAIVAAIAIVPVLLATGSRAGVVLAPVGIGVAAWVALRFDGRTFGGSVRRWQVLAGGVGILLIALLAIWLARDASIQRALSSEAGDETRLQYLPLLFDLMKEFFPVGSGLGTFDPVFRSFETREILQPNYLNHAHNDLIEIIIETGVAGVALLAGFGIWLIGRARQLIASRTRHESLWFARIGLVVIGMTFLASLVDYPLRTPLFAAMFAVASAWISGYNHRNSQAASE